jgi:hypothetical protein
MALGDRRGRLEDATSNQQGPGQVPHGRAVRLSKGIDTSVAHPARVYDYWLGGKDNFAADREAAEQVIAVRPSILRDVRANRDFLRRSVQYLVSEAGIRQFLDIGTGIPAANNTHEVAQAIEPATQVVYVDNDPIVLAHARALLNPAPGGRTDYLDADLRDPDHILTLAGNTLDLSQPIGLLLIGVLHLIGDDEDPYGLTGRLLEPLPPGSHLAATHPASDIDAHVVAEGARRYNERVVTPQTRRSQAQFARFFDTLELVEPGVVQCHRWRPDPTEPAPSGQVSAHCAVGRKG